MKFSDDAIRIAQYRREYCITTKRQIQITRHVTPVSAKCLTVYQKRGTNDFLAVLFMSDVHRLPLNFSHLHSNLKVVLVL